MNIYVVATHNDGRDGYTGDAYAIKFSSKQEAEKFLHEKPAPYDTRTRQMLTEDQFWLHGRCQLILIPKARQMT